MAINPADVKLVRAERNTDETDGGGMMTGTALVSGDVNNLWADISQNLQVRGGVSLRKLYGAIRAANADSFLGAGFGIIKDAGADNVSTLLFSTGSHYDERSAAQDKIEQFVVLSTRSPLRPVGTQRAGQTSIVCYASKRTDAPEVGEVLFLIYGSNSEAIKVLDVAVQSAAYTYVDNAGEYKTYNAFEIVLSISQPLSMDFAGVDPAPKVESSTDIFKTQSNSSAKYYGIKPLAVDAAVGDSSVIVDSIFQPIIPASTSETAYVDQTPGIIQKMVQPTSATIKTRSFGTITGAQFFTLPSAWVPGTLQMTVGGSVYDEASGSLRLLSGSNYLSDVAVDAAAGTLGFTVSGSRSVSVSYTAGVAVELTPYTDAVVITSGNRQLTYTFQLSPVPAAGTLSIDFSYLNKWYSIADDGTGVLSGPGASGSINYNTGSGSITLPGEPDIGSSIIYTWAQSPYSVATAGSRSVWFDIGLDDQPIAGTMVAAWSRNGTDYTATADSSDVLSGGAGSVTNDALMFTPANLPTGDITLTYDKLNSAVLTSDIAVTAQTGSSLVLDIGQTNVVAGSLSLDLDLTYTQTTLTGGVLYESRVATTVTLKSNAAGNLSNRTWGSALCGTVDHAAGTITINGDLFVRSVTNYTKVDSVLGGWQKTTTNQTLRIETQTVSVSYRSTSAGTSVTQMVAVADLALKVQVAPDMVVPGSTVLMLDGIELVDGGDGVLYQDYNLTTAAGLTAGALDYANGMAEINYDAVRESVDALTATLDAAAIGLGAAVAVTKVVFRTIAAPLRSSGLQFLARRATDGALMRAVSDNDGVITGTFDDSDTISELPQPGSINGYVLPFVPKATTGGSASGDVDSNAGVVTIVFTQPVILSTLTYNAVVYTTVPQDPDRLGLNPVRLPSNGQVPVFKDGYLALIHNTASFTEASPVAGQMLDCGRVDVAQIVIVDAVGKALALDQYSVDLAAGTATLADPFSAIDENANSLTLPLTISHRIEDRAVITSASVTGQLQLNLTLTHDYALGDSYVSALVEVGDLQARVHNTFFQQVDSVGVFLDELSGSAATASYDDLSYPIAVDSLGCVEDRWKLKFTSSTGFQCISEQRGVVGTGSISADFSPINPFTGTPYFTVLAAGWGAGWVTSNVVRFNTDACAAPVWVVRTVTPSNQDLADDSIVIEFMGDAD